MKKTLSLLLVTSFFALPAAADEGGYSILMDLQREAEQRKEDSALVSLKTARTTPLVAGRDSANPALRLIATNDYPRAAEPAEVPREIREQADALQAALASLTSKETQRTPLSTEEQNSLRPLRILLAQDLEEEDDNAGEDEVELDAGRATHQIGAASPRNGTPELRINTTGDRVVSHGMDYLGVRYRYGGTSRSTGVDCSGLVLNVFQHSVGMRLPRTAAEQARVGVRVNRDQLKPGDLVFFNTSRRANSHVGIYIGNNRMLHAPRSGGVVRIEDISKKYWATRYNGARRIVIASAQ